MTWTYGATFLKVRTGFTWIPAAFWNGDHRWCVTQHYDKCLISKKWDVVWAPMGRPFTAYTMSLNEAKDCVRRLVEDDCDYAADDRVALVRIKTRMPPPIIAQMNPVELKSGYAAALGLLGNIGKAIAMAYESTVFHAIRTFIDIGKKYRDYREAKFIWNSKLDCLRLNFKHMGSALMSAFCLGRIGQTFARLFEDDHLARSMLLEVEVPRNAIVGEVAAKVETDPDVQKIADRFDLLEMN